MRDDLNASKKKRKPSKKGLTAPRGSWEQELPLWRSLRKHLVDAWVLYIYACDATQRPLGKVKPKKTEAGKSEKLLENLNTTLKRKDRKPGKKRVEMAGQILVSHNSLSQLKQLCRELPATAKKYKEAATNATAQALKVRNQMLARHQGLVQHLAGKLQVQEDCGDCLDRDDLVQYGYTGLIVAVERFEPERGYRFSTFATWWVIQAIRAAVKEAGRTIRLPHNVFTNLRVAKRILKEKTDEAGGKVEFDSALDQMGLRPTETDQVHLAQIQSNLKRLDQPLKNDKNHTLADCLGCNPKYDQHIDNEKLRRVIRTEIRRLIVSQNPAQNARVQELLFRRHGFHGGKPETLASMGRRYNLSRERVRQLEAMGMKALKKQLKEHEQTLKAMGYNLTKSKRES